MEQFFPRVRMKREPQHFNEIMKDKTEVSDFRAFANFSLASVIKMIHTSTNV